MSERIRKKFKKNKLVTLLSYYFQTVIHSKKISLNCKKVFKPS